MAAGQQQEQDRTEPASPYKLREARKRGQVAKSLEINSFLMLSVALVVTYFLGEKLITEQLLVSKQLFIDAGQLQLDSPTVLALFESIVSRMANALWPLVGAIMLIGILANMFQTGPILSFFPLKPDFDRLNPVNGFKRVFSKKLLFESFKTVIKMSIFGTIVYLAIVAMLPKLLALIDIDPAAYPPIMMDHARSLAYKLLLALLLIALLDLVYSRWDFGKQMRMSRREMKEEVKRREGDPQVRARRRQLQKEAVSRAGAVKRVPDADVLITNPTHLAVALKYDRDQGGAPLLVAKGAGELASRLREVARKHRVPVVENKALARALFNKVRLDEAVPQDLFPSVARILAWVYLQRQQRKPIDLPGRPA